MWYNACSIYCIQLRDISFCYQGKHLWTPWQQRKWYSSKKSFTAPGFQRRGKSLIPWWCQLWKSFLETFKSYTQNYRSTYLCLSQPRSRTTSCVTASYIKIRMHHTAKQQLPKLLVQTSASSWWNWSFSVNSKKLIHIVTCGKNQTKETIYTVFTRAAQPETKTVIWTWHRLCQVQMPIFLCAISHKRHKRLYRPHMATT